MPTAPARQPAAPVRDLWMPATVQVAWELVTARVRVAPLVLAEAREHLLRHLGPNATSDDLARMARPCTADYLRRVREGRYLRVESDEQPGPPPPSSWRDALLRGLDPIGKAVFRMHFGNGHDHEVIEKHTGVDRTALVAAKEGLREHIRELAAMDGHALHSYPNAMVDAVLCKLADLPMPGCPGPMGLETPTGKKHAADCPRCGRATRLIDGGALARADLFPPVGRPLIPDGEVRLLSVLLHPEARSHRRGLKKALGPHAIAAGPDAWLIAQDDLADVLPQLEELALEGRPARHQLRGALVRGPARWARGVLLGPLPVEALETARARPWGDFQGLPELPAALPPPPRASVWWAGAVAAGLGCLGMVAYEARTPAFHPTHPIEAVFQSAPDGWQVRFDTDDLAVVDVIVREGGTLRTYRSNLQAGKGAWATGGGDFAFQVAADGVAIISSPHGVPELPALLFETTGGIAPLERLESRLREEYPDADLARTPPPRPQEP